MTREHKLAIIVGFSLVLVVGILISDHLSPASLDEPVDFVAVQLPIGRRELPPAIVPGVMSRGESAPQSGEVIEGPRTEIALGTDRPLLVPVGPAPDEVRIDPLVIRLGGIGNGSQSPVIQKLEGGNPQGIATGPSYALYTVKPRDSLSDIARQHLGSAAKWREIAAVNPGKVGKNGEIRSGDVLRIPLVAGSSARVPSIGGTPEVKKPEVKVPEQKLAASKAVETTRTYVVQPNDSLSQIAQKVLGSSKRMDEILALNKDKIDDPNEIYAGLSLRLPAR